MCFPKEREKKIKTTILILSSQKQIIDIDLKISSFYFSD